MKAILAGVLLNCFLISPAWAASLRSQARELLKKQDFSGAVAAYKAIPKGSSDAGLVAEYAYSLALLGFTDLALTQLDRAFIEDAASAEVLYFGSSVLLAMGLEEAAQEISRPAPVWMANSRTALENLEPERELGDFEGELASANLLMTQMRYVSASVRFKRITEKYPDEGIAWAGYAIALEKMGAYRAAARAVEKDIELSEPEEQSMKVKTAYKSELESQPPLKSLRANRALQGRYLAFMGGSLNRTSGNTVSNLNVRMGKFFTNRFDAALNAGVVSGNISSSQDGVNAGASARYHQPLPLALPLNGTIGLRLSYDPAPSDNFSIYFSPGLSYFLSDSSIDLFLDIALSGPLKNSQTLSLGYSVYFGGKGK